jgi:hypothetical protein
MSRILSILRDVGFRCLPCARVTLDTQAFEEYRDSEAHPAETLFERSADGSIRKQVPDLAHSIPTILHYFMDGSRRTYRVADLILQGRYLPVIAGQIGVVVVQRLEDEKRIIPLREFCRFKNVIAFPSRASEDDRKVVQERIDEQSPIPFEIVEYQLKADADPVDLGVARIMSEMHDMEIGLVQKAASQHLLRLDRLLVIDGPLRFRKKFDIVQFRNVLGLSKTFRPSFVVGQGRRKTDVGAIAAGLDIGERSSAFKTTEGTNTIGMWYLRLRPRHWMSEPLQGVVKLECFAVDVDDIENGFESDRIDNISSHLLRERNVTPFRADARWASHIYPIYLAEGYLKSSFMSDVRFKALF